MNSSPVATVEPCMVHEIPAVLREKPHWVGFSNRDGQKVPCMADRPNRKPSSTDPATWRSFAITLAGLRVRRYDAVAYALNGDFVCVDLDDCMTDGVLTPDAAAIVERLNTFTEVSISGRGIHCWLAGTLPAGKGWRRDGIEVYGTSRFIICTGKRLPGTPPAIRQADAGILQDLGGRQEEYTERLRHGDTETRRQSPLSLCLSVKSSSSSSDLEGIFIATLPRDAGQRNLAVFRLARALRWDCGLDGKSLSDVRPVVEEWHRRALPVIRTKPFDDTWADFVYGWKRARSGILCDPVAAAMKDVDAEIFPPEATRFDSEESKRLLALCWHLARLDSSGGFFLSCGKAATVLQISRVTINKRLHLFVSEGLLAVEHEHSEYRATRFKWLGAMTPATDPAKPEGQVEPTPPPALTDTDVDTINKEFDDGADMGPEPEPEQTSVEQSIEGDCEDDFVKRAEVKS